MKISLPLISQVAKCRQTNPVRFSSRNTVNGTINGDVFERSSVKTVTQGKKSVTGNIVKTVLFQDRKGNPVNGYILEDSEVPNHYYACDNKTVLCKMITENQPDCLFIDYLFGQNNQGDIKGAGTELLKFAVEESKRQKHKGRIKLEMAGSFPFYFKNNVRVPENEVFSAEENAVSDYMTRTGFHPERLWMPLWGMPTAELDEKGANALLNNERIMDSSKSSVLYSTQLKRKGRVIEIDADFCDFGDKFVIQFIDKNAPNCAQLAFLQGDIKHGQLIPKEKPESAFGYDSEEAFIKEFQNALSASKEHYSKCK